MTDLTDRIAAGQGDNAEVLRALGWEKEGHWSWVSPRGQHLWLKGEDGDDLPDPLDSVDDALRLVPEGWTVSLMQYSATKWAAVLVSARPSVNTTHGPAPTAARALTIAILRTKETTND